MAELELIPDLLSDSPVFSSIFHDVEEAILYLIGGKKFIEFGSDHFKSKNNMESSLLK